MAACDVQCHRDKELKRLSSDVLRIIPNREKDPEAYEKARTAYYTVKEGQGWVAAENEKKANEAVQPILDSYQAKFDKMKEDMIYADAAAQAKQDALNNQVGDEDEVRFIHREIMKERDEASVYQRLQELAGIPVDVYAWLPSFLDLVLGVTILVLVFQIFIQGKLSNIKNYFTNNNGVA
jgi:hypothetical protein